MHKLPPSLMALVNNLHRILLALGLTRERENVLGLAVRDFVDPEPLVGRTDQSGEVSLHILDIVQSRCKRVVDVDDEDFPVSLAFVEERHDTEHLDLLDLASVRDGFADLTDVERVVVTVGPGLGVLDVRVLPSLGEGTVVPDVTCIGSCNSQRNQSMARRQKKKKTDVPWWGKQLRTYRSLPFLMSCLMGLKVSSLEISILALVHRGTSTTTTD